VILAANEPDLNVQRLEMSEAITVKITARGGFVSSDMRRAEVRTADDWPNVLTSPEFP
jgi:hypothetical protein